VSTAAAAESVALLQAENMAAIAKIASTFFI
jgi:hypothetical protein